MPSRQKAMAAARPPIPAPMMPTWMFLWFLAGQWLFVASEGVHMLTILAVLYNRQISYRAIN